MGTALLPLLSSDPDQQWSSFAGIFQGMSNGISSSEKRCVDVRNIAG